MPTISRVDASACFGSADSEENKHREEKIKSEWGRGERAPDTSDPSATA